MDFRQATVAITAACFLALGLSSTASAGVIGTQAHLTNTELARVAQEMQTLPAGGDSLLAVIGIVFIVLLILELTGVTDIFKKI